LSTRLQPLAFNKTPIQIFETNLPHEPLTVIMQGSIWGYRVLPASCVSFLHLQYNNSSFRGTLRSFTLYPCTSCIFRNTMSRVSSLRKRFGASSSPEHLYYTYPQHGQTPPDQPKPVWYETMPQSSKRRLLPNSPPLVAREVQQEAQVNELMAFGRGRIGKARVRLTEETFVLPERLSDDPFNMTEPKIGSKGKGKGRQDSHVAYGLEVPKLRQQRRPETVPSPTLARDIYFSVTDIARDIESLEPNDDLPPLIQGLYSHGNVPLGVPITTSHLVGGSLRTVSSAQAGAYYRSSSTYGAGYDETICPDGTYRPSQPLTDEPPRTPSRHYAPMPPPSSTPPPIQRQRQLVMHAYRPPRTPPPRLPASYRPTTAFSFERPPTTTPFSCPSAPTYPDLFPTAELSCSPVPGPELEFRALQRVGERRTGPYRTVWPEERRELWGEIEGIARRIAEGNGWVGRDKDVVKKTKHEEEQELDEIVDQEDGDTTRKYGYEVEVKRKKKCKWWKRWYCGCANCKPSPSPLTNASGRPLMSDVLRTHTPPKTHGTLVSTQSDDTRNPSLVLARQTPLRDASTQTPNPAPAPSILFTTRWSTKRKASTILASSSPTRKRRWWPFRTEKQKAKVRNEEVRLKRQASLKRGLSELRRATLIVSSQPQTLNNFISRA
jgi:hypothetical protein